MSLATLLVLADGRLPAGGHAHSGGFEAAVSAGRVRDLAGLRGFLEGRLHTSGLVAAAFAAASSSTASFAAASSTAASSTAASSTAASSTAASSAVAASSSAAASSAAASSSAAAGRIAALDDGMDARTPSPALRRASRAQGRALLRAGRAMWPVTTTLRDPHHPVALGLVAAAAGLGPVEAATAAAYGTVTGPASAAVRLLGLDPYAVHALVAGLADRCDRIAARAAAVAREPVDDLPADGAPLLDVGAEHHASWEVRLFAS